MDVNHSDLSDKKPLEKISTHLLYKVQHCKTEGVLTDILIIIH